MRDLDDVFTEAIQRREQSLLGTAPTQLGSRVARAVRRRRARRASLHGVALVAVGALLGVTGWWGLHGSAAPAVLPPASGTPAPSGGSGPSSTPTAAQTPSPSLGAGATAGSPTAAPTLLTPPSGLPPMQAAPSDIWSRTGAGWVLGVYRPVVMDNNFVYDHSRPGADVLVLASPDGTLYRLHDLPGDVDVARWRAGTTTATTTDGRRLDLTTGQVSGTAAPGLAQDFFWKYHDFIGQDPTGRGWWRGYVGSVDQLVSDLGPLPWGAGSNPLLSPDRQKFLLTHGTAELSSTFTLVDIPAFSADVSRYTPSTLTYQVPGKACAAISWSSSSSFVAVCESAPAAAGDSSWIRGPKADPALYTVDSVTGVASLVGPLDASAGVVPEPGSGAYVSDGVVVSAGTTGWADPSTVWYGCDTGVYRWQAGKATPLLTEDGPYWHFHVEVIGGSTWIDQVGCGDGVPRVLSVIGPDGSAREVFPAPHEALPDAAWAQGLTSWAVAQ